MSQAPQAVTPRQDRRLAYLDGLRGVAALIVVVFHYCSAFLPALVLGVLTHRVAIPAWQRWFAASPFGAMINGLACVDIFFLLSGFVLQRAYARNPRFLNGLFKRVIRLATPATIATFLAGFILSMGASIHFQAAGISDSGWLGQMLAQPLAISSVLKEAFLYSVFLGYNIDLLSHLLNHVVSIPDTPQSFNPPFWTLNIEFIGSILCLLLAVAGNRKKYLVPVLLFALATIVLTQGFMILFLVGYFFSKREPRYLNHWAAWLLLLVGVMLCSPGFFLPIDLSKALFHFVPAALKTSSLLHAIEAMIGPILVFVAILHLPPLKTGFSVKPIQFLGKISFSLYLVHFPIMATLGCWVFLMSEKRIGVQPAALLALLCGLAVTLPFAYLFERFVDAPAIGLSRMTKIFSSSPLPASKS